MSTFIRLSMMAAVALAAACGPETTETASTAAATRPARLRVELTTQPDIADIPRLLAIDAMRAKGYTVETLAFANTPETVLALEGGDLDFAVVSDVTGFSAINRGAPLVAVLDDSLNATVLAATKRIARCADLDGKRVATPSLGSGKSLMLAEYFERRCPGVKPTTLVVAGEEARLAGLFAGELDAAVLDFENAQRRDSRGRVELWSLAVFADEFPGVTITSVFTRRALAERFPATVKDWIRAMLEARRRLQDPKVLVGESVTRLRLDPSVSQNAADTFLQRRYWDVNGRFTTDIIQKNVDLVIGSGALPQGTRAGELVDSSFLNAVLDDIGRR